MEPGPIPAPGGGDVQILELHGPSAWADRRGWLIHSAGGAGRREGQAIAWASAFARLRARHGSLPPQDRLVAGEADTSSAAGFLVRLARVLLAVFPLEIRAIPGQEGSQQEAFYLACLQHDLAGEALGLARRLAVEAQVLVTAGFQPGAASDRAAAFALKIFQEKVRRCHHAPTTGQLLAARERGIPYWLMDPLWRLYQLGTGCRSHWISGTASDRDPSLATLLCQDKARTHRLLENLGIPVPRQVVLPCTCSREDVRRAAQAIGYPCVVKPLDADQGRGVSLAITDPEGLERAIEKARCHSQRGGLLIEEEIGGRYCRLNLVEGTIVAAFQYSIPFVVGDGIQPIALLIEAVRERQRQRDPAVRADRELVIDAITLSTLAEGGWELESVPAPGERVTVRRDLEDRSDWFYTPVLDILPPSLHRLAQRVALAVGIPVIGVDCMAPVIREGCPLEEGEAVVLEVNSSPLLHPDYAGQLIDSLFPSAREASVPTEVVLLAPAEAESDAQSLQPFLHPQRGTVVAAPQRLAAVASRLAQALGVHAQPYGHPRQVLMDRSIAHLIFVVDGEEVRRHGMPVERADRLLEVGSDRRPLDGNWRAACEELGWEIVPVPAGGTEGPDP